jgi:hypothetical protein
MWQFGQNERMRVLVSLLGFSAVYGLILINWVDLFNPQMPGYHIWLIQMYLAPFGLILLLRGAGIWPVALASGLFVSLMNDLFYYPIGDLLFGFHTNLAVWWAQQFGLMGGRVLWTFEGGAFTFPVTSMIMAASIFARIAVVGMLVYYWSSRSKRAE